MTNPQWLELPMFRTNFHGPKDVRAIEGRLYIVLVLLYMLLMSRVNCFWWDITLTRLLARHYVNTPFLRDITLTSLCELYISKPPFQIRHFLKHKILIFFSISTRKHQRSLIRVFAWYFVSRKGFKLSSLYPGSNVNLRNMLFPLATHSYMPLNTCIM